MRVVVLVAYRCVLALRVVVLVAYRRVLAAYPRVPVAYRHVFAPYLRVLVASGRVLAPHLRVLVPSRPASRMLPRVRIPFPLVPVAASVVVLGCGSAGVAQDGGPPSHPPDAKAIVDARADSARPVDAFHAADVVPPRDAARDTPSDSTHDAGRDAFVPTGDATSTDARAETSVADVSPPDAAATCLDGTPVAYTRTACSGTPGAVPSSLSSALLPGAGSLGDVISLGGLHDSSLPCFAVRVCVPASAPTLLFSDDPESPSADGVLYADALAAGNYRAYVYHTNAGTGLRKFPVVLLNQGTTTVHAIITAEGVAGPSQDYVDVGKQALLRWYTSRAAATPTTVLVPAGARVLLDANLDAVHASTNDLAHAVIDFSVDGPVKLSVVSVLSTEDATVVTSGLSLLPPDGMHMRGSFPGANLEIESVDPVDAAGARHLRLGGDVTDVSLAGHDYVDNTSVTLDGNYGVSYALNIAFASGFGGSGLVLSPQGGAWGGAASVAAGPSLLPSAQDSLGTQTQAIVLGSYAAGTRATVGFVSAGGSSLPVDLVSVPLP